MSNDLKLKQADVLYLAGVLDARGKFLIYPHKSSAASKKSYRQVRIRVHSSDGAWLEYLKKLTDVGSMSSTGGKDRAETYTWTVLGAAATELLKVVKPHLRSADAVRDVKAILSGA